MSLFDKLVVNTLPLMPEALVWPVSKRYIAGKTLDDAVRTCRDLMQQGACATFDLLGENIERKEEATAAKDTYLHILDVIKSDKLDANISIKPTQMGLSFKKLLGEKESKEFCYQNVRELVKKANALGNFVRIDMEDTPYTSDTLEMYTRLHDEFPKNVGVVIQAYLRRTVDDVQMLMQRKANLRLCKGIYIEPRELAYKTHPLINKNYIFLLQELLKNGNYIGIATHHEELVWGAMRIVHDLKLPKTAYEFQMLLGVDEELRRIILKAGHRLRVYIPYGEQWYAYSVRRLKENPAISRHVIKQFFGIQG